MITVAVASYNHRMFVEQCLKSIIDQSYSPIELCWIDDCSLDGTFEEVLRLIESPSVRNRFISFKLKQNRQNRGAAFSLNQAARLGTAPLISFMNSDDYYHPERLDIMSRAFKSDTHFFSFSNVLPVDVTNRALVIDPTGERIAFDAERLVARFDGVSRAFLSRQIASSTGNFLVSRSLFDAIGGYQDLQYCHDWMFALQACLICEPTFVRDRLYFYRLHATNSFRSLASLAEAETRAVLSEFFSRLALVRPQNPLAPCPRRFPAGFWDIVRSTGTKEAADRIFFPYSRDTRVLAKSVMPHLPSRH